MESVFPHPIPRRWPAYKYLFYPLIECKFPILHPTTRFLAPDGLPPQVRMKRYAGYAVFCFALSSRPSSVMSCAFNSNFFTLPLAVSGSDVTNLMYFGTLCLLIPSRQ
jgi:hypothetical protein